MRRDGRVAVVTGGGQGIAMSCAGALAESGAIVVIADIAPGVAESGRDALRAKGCAVSLQQVDVTKPGEVDALAEAALRDHGRADILVVNAGIARSGTVDFTMTAAKRAAIDLDPVLLSIAAIVGQVPMKPLARSERSCEGVERGTTCLTTLHEARRQADDVEDLASDQLAEGCIGVEGRWPRGTGQRIRDHDTNRRSLKEHTSKPDEDHR
jgi:NAD(P)-dependent dehydrogenase (short-subunit alcohol dehydrogenase family)